MLYYDSIMLMLWYKPNKQSPLPPLSLSLFLPFWEYGRDTVVLGGEEEASTHPHPHPLDETLT